VGVITIRSGTDQSQIAIDQVDNPPKKNLLTHMVRSQLLEQDAQKLQPDFTLAQTTSALQMKRGIAPAPCFGTTQRSRRRFRRRKKFSDVWLRAVITTSLNCSPSWRPGIGRGAGAVSLAKPPINRYGRTPFRSFIGRSSQFNTDFRRSSPMRVCGSRTAL
jgi:hypothetical protein